MDRMAAPRLRSRITQDWNGFLDAFLVIHLGNTSFGFFFLLKNGLSKKFDSFRQSGLDFARREGGFLDSPLSI
jgi:hypothetical protein